ncbi:Hint domain-containing protein [Roseobacteraceae bacterium NS-SX3]
MALYTATAFRWSGTGYNAQYNTSHTAVFRDSDGAYEGGGDGGERISIDGGSFGKTAGSPYAIDASFTAADGSSHVETFYFFNTSGSWYFAPGPGSAFTTGATLGSYQGYSTGWNYTDVTCFVRGTRIATPSGLVPVEDLAAGDKVVTAEGRHEPLRLVLRRKLSAEEIARNPKLRPVRITAGALGNGLPKRDLLVSRQHRMLVSSKIASRMFGQRRTLVAAIRLTALRGIREETAARDVEYFHLVLDEHETVFAEGAPSESLFLGPQAMKTMTAEAIEELQTLFPDLAFAAAPPRPAYYVPVAKKQKELVTRHRKNRKPLLESQPGPVTV